MNVFPSRNVCCRYCSERCRRSRGQTPQALASATMAPSAPSISHSSAKAGRSPEANKSRRCQDLGNIVHLEHLNLEASYLLSCTMAHNSAAYASIFDVCIVLNAVA